MLFNSYIFCFLFLPLCIIIYFTLNRFKKYKLAQLFLLIMSFWFYGYFNYYYLLIIVVSILFNFAIYKIFNRVNSKRILSFILILSILANCGLLFYFKYYDFFISNINSIFKSNWNLHNVILPLGISFFTFQQISFVIDAYKKQVPKYSLIEYASFVTFFPQLVAGPIVSHDELIPQFLDENKKKFNWDNFYRGSYIFVIGLSKKILVADVFGNAVNYGFSNLSTLDATNAIIVMLAYTIQIYFDFSGYSDMAIGLGKLFNFDLPVNFDSPYKALDILEFWKRWHITLTRFFTKYIYIPLGGNRKGKIRTYINILIIFLLSGIWHGANWTFILWGLLHGVYSIITRIFKKFFDNLHPVLNWSITFLFINFTWVLFRANTITDGIGLINKILLMNFGPINDSMAGAFRLTEFKIFGSHILSIYPYIFMLLYFIFALIIILGAKNTIEKSKELNPNYLNATLIAILFVWCILSFSGISTFLYFNF